MAIATFAAGCFWGVEEAFRVLEGVNSTRVGYTGGTHDNPSYQDVCSGTTGHAEAVEVRFDPRAIAYEKLLETFWSVHDPTQLNRQGPDVGHQYRSAIFVHDDEQEAAATASRAALQERSSKPVATEITRATTFHEAEEYHQQYLAKRGRAGCGLKAES